MPVRSSMSDLIAKIRLMIADPAGSSQHFLDQDIQDYLDANRDDIRYEGLTIAPSIVSNSYTNNTPQTIFADYYSKYGYWEDSVTLQGTDSSGNPWKVLTPVSSELLLDIAHWQFELDVYGTGTVPGQLPPIFATGHVYDCFRAAADLLDIWAASLACAYDIVVDGQSLRRSQLMTAKHVLAERYRIMAKPKLTKLVREDVRAPVSSKKIRLLDDEDVYRGF